MLGTGAPGPLLTTWVVVAPGTLPRPMASLSRGFLLRARRRQQQTTQRRQEAARMAAATATATCAHRGPGVGAEMGPKCPCGQHCRHPARPAPGPSWAPQLTGTPGNEVWKEPGCSRGAHGGRGTVGACGMPHRPTLLAWRRWPGRPGHLWGWPSGLCPPPRLPAAASPGGPGREAARGGRGDGYEWSQPGEALGFGQSASLAATGLAPWPPPRPPALAT